MKSLFGLLLVLMMFSIGCHSNTVVRQSPDPSQSVIAEYQQQITQWKNDFEVLKGFKGLSIPDEDNLKLTELNSKVVQYAASATQQTA